MHTCEMLGFVNNRMVKSYVESKSLATSGLQHSIAIHYRCGDNFAFGLMPHDAYIQLLSLPEVIDMVGKVTPVQVVIHTDAVKGSGQWADHFLASSQHKSLLFHNIPKRRYQSTILYPLILMCTCICLM